MGHEPVVLGAGGVLACVQWAVHEVVTHQAVCGLALLWTAEPRVCIFALLCPCAWPFLFAACLQLLCRTLLCCVCCLNTSSFSSCRVVIVLCCSSGVGLLDMSCIGHEQVCRHMFVSV